MKRTNIALVTLLSAIVLSQYSCKSQADPIPSALVGTWKSGNGDTFGMGSDGSYYYYISKFGPPGGAYGNCTTALFLTTRGRFTVNGSQVTYYPQTYEESTLGGCSGANGPISLPKQSTYKDGVYSVYEIYFGNNGQNLAISYVKVNLDNPSARGTQIYQKKSN